jgi:hypothetical protein
MTAAHLAAYEALLSRGAAALSAAQDGQAVERGQNKTWKAQERI